MELYKIIYAVERYVKGRSPRVIKKLRRRSRKLFVQMYRHIESANVRPTSLLGKAVTYAINHKAELFAYLDNPQVPISNIRAEHVAKKIAVARKNFLFCNTAQGAQALANVMTVVYTAELYPEHHTQAYITALFIELPKAKTLKALEALLPWNLSPQRVRGILALRPKPDLTSPPAVAI